MPITLKFWMWERIVQILKKSKYTGAKEIIREIKNQMKDANI